MKRLFTILVLVLAVAALGGLFGAASKASADGMQGKGGSADAQFIYMFDSCTELDTWVSASTWTGLSVQVSLWDVCADVQLGFWYGSTDAADVQISRLDASAAGTVEICDAYGCFPLDVLVVWHADNASRDIFIDNHHDPMCKYHSITRSHMATAVGAVVMEDGWDQTPDPAVWAAITAGHSNEVCKF